MVRTTVGVCYHNTAAVVLVGHLNASTKTNASAGWSGSSQSVGVHGTAIGHGLPTVSITHSVVASYSTPSSSFGRLCNASEEGGSSECS